MKIPFIPDAAPFNDEQRSWLSGFLAGLHSRAAMKTTGPEDEAAPEVKPHVFDILFGTQTGTAEILAQDAARAARAKGMKPRVTALDDISMDQLGEMDQAIIFISTYGEGEMPDNAQLFWEALSSDTAPRLEKLGFGVLALGDTSYEEFCHAGKLMDMRLEQLGAKRLLDRVDCDVDFEDPAAAWIEAVIPAIADAAPAETSGAAVAPAAVVPVVEEPEKPKWGRKNPFPAPTIENRLLSGPGSAKEIRHYSFDLAGSGLSYEAGDALNVLPKNNAELVNGIIGQLGADPDMIAPGLNLPLREALRMRYEIMTPSKSLIEEVAERTSHEEFKSVASSGDKDAMDSFLWGRDVLDLISLDPSPVFSVEEFLPYLKSLQHRAYSISSSPKAHGDEVHLTIASVRWDFEGRAHKGVCSTYLADAVGEADIVPVFLSPNKAFRVPENNDVPIIMVGPGTGVAPFRAFLHERRERGATGRNWLFFGDQHRAEDFIYEDEISAMSADGLLTRLDLAFSRDQNEKIYVQTRMRENGKALYSWLEEGAVFYVCGDATRMAKDVDKALHALVAEHGGLSSDGADAYVANLKREKRYLRDVY